MRLIDADKLKDTLLKHRYTTEHNQIFRYIDEQPTAYSVDEIVEELEERKALHERLVDYETKNGTVTGKYQHIKAIDVLNDAIEIVKQGGVSGDVCEWKYTREIMDNAEFKVGCNQNALKRCIVPNNFSYCNFKYCPYCGKKIKVVE